MAYDPAKSRWASKFDVYGPTAKTPKGRRVVIYGKSGAGKTTLAATAPKPLFLDFDRGENVALSSGAFPVLYFQRDKPVFEPVRDLLLAWLRGTDVFDPDGGPYADRQSIVIDTWTKLNSFLLVEAAAIDDPSTRKKGRDLTEQKASFDEFNMIYNRQDLISSLLADLSVQKGINVVITTLPKLEGDEMEEMKRKDGESSSGWSNVEGKPLLIGKFKEQMGADVSDAYYLEVIESGGRKLRRIWTEPHLGYFAKTRWGLPPSIDDPTWDKIMSLSKVK